METWFYRFGCFCGATSGHVEKRRQFEFHLYTFFPVLYIIGAKGESSCGEFCQKMFILFYLSIFQGIFRIDRQLVFWRLAERSTLLETCRNNAMFTDFLNGVILSNVSNFVQAGGFILTTYFIDDTR